ncbi:L-lactate dehydrogenase (FMN-dependent) and related alpha-hydroxy acid dehydrogenases [Candidatus Scalindua japonica]|uniref:L-lactate dehydrogenase (FMN-dependent) and related alpha-hydroxy acid dehydrogenases n=1 Tax=Candidatus Scalindua japonica TaxID=1284222 RepID=A0A286U3I1_9BACT|nr:hypothetical protein [Candidatus Scalindua japonica]GAX62693.1 L-lactate dehydrogenase (FMN-dependent) and related alpha-hydroxy acid dehydrogenases [Candidatus Scalindua japonica]
MKLLKNKFFVVILVISAVGIVANNILLPLFPSARYSSQTESGEEAEKLKEQIFHQIEFIEKKPDPVADFNNIDWAHGYLRDPFVKKTMMDVETVSDTPVALVVQNSQIQDILFAVVHDSGKALAVINDVIVGEGDYYDDYKVVKIGLDSVKLEGPDGNKMLEF